MVKHIILWKLKEEYNNAEIKQGIKNGLEGLSGKIPGLLEIKVETDRLESSNADVMLYSVFEDEDALKGYSSNPIHVEVADSKVRPFTKTRLCMDFCTDR
ncbi:MAG: Dabb family protein [Clostridia bacterium]|nr:Dabb family protein [Clostridia bacterium]